MFSFKYFKNLSQTNFINLFLSISLVTGQLNLYYSFQKLQKESYNNNTFSSLLSQHEDQIKILNNQIVELNSNLKTINNSTIIDNDISLSTNQKVNTVLESHSSSLIDIVHSPLFLYCFKTTVCLTVGYLTVKKIKTIISPLFALKGLFTGAAGIFYSLSHPSTPPFIKGFFNSYFSSKTTVLAKVDTSVDFFPFHITADLLSDNVISNLQVSLGNESHVPLFPVLMTTVHILDYINRHYSTTDANYSASSETTTVEEETTSTDLISQPSSLVLPQTNSQQLVLNTGDTNSLSDTVVLESTTTTMSTALVPFNDDGDNDGEIVSIPVLNINNRVSDSGADLDLINEVLNIF